MGYPTHVCEALNLRGDQQLYHKIQDCGVAEFCEDDYELLALPLLIYFNHAGFIPANQLDELHV